MIKMNNIDGTIEKSRVFETPVIMAPTIGILVNEHHSATRPPLARDACLGKLDCSASITDSETTLYTTLFDC